MSRQDRRIQRPRLTSLLVEVSLHVLNSYVSKVYSSFVKPNQEKGNMHHARVYGAGRKTKAVSQSDLEFLERLLCGS
jgi:hypothetical protein